MASLVADYGLFLLFVLIAMESAGVPLPGETALVAAGVLASRGDMDIVAVIAAAATAAIVGDNIGYWAGRLGGRRSLERWEAREGPGSPLLPRAEPSFQRPGGTPSFPARFL